MQSEADDAAVMLQYFPAAQSVHALTPVSGLYLPAGQVRQSEYPLPEWYPAEHGVQDDAADEE